MKIYLVGGAVRDKLLNLTVNERDYVVVGASTAEMMRLGYQQVGKEFPVFLHPQTREEYALARMERKTEPGYTGFKFDTSSEVTLEEDLLRRDLTINAMAEDEDGNIIDPFNGRADLDNRILRHVSPAFAEDPVRILRLGRFLARYAYLGFTVAPETTALMLNMVKDGEVNALVAERVWKELVRALTEKNPEKFFEVLSSCDANKILFPELTKADIDALIVATTVTEQAVIRYATLLHRLNEHDVRAISTRYRVPNAYRELAIFVRRHSQTALRCQQASADQLLNLFHALDIFRREPRFHDFLMACKIIAKYQNKAFSDEWLLSCALAAKSYDVQLLIQQGLMNKTLADALKQKRHEQIVAWLAKNR